MSWCYACGKYAKWHCDYAGEFGTCDHDMCDEHFVPEFKDYPPSASNPEPYTLCLDHAFDQKS